MASPDAHRNVYLSALYMSESSESDSASPTPTFSQQLRVPAGLTLTKTSVTDIIVSTSQN
jgi:hypothetical protein